MDESGAGVPAAAVRVRYPGEQRTFRFADEVGTSTSDEFGYFLLPAVSQNKPFVLDVVANSRPLSSSNSITAQTNTLTNVMIVLKQRGQPVSGRITNTIGEALEGVRIRIVATADRSSYSIAERDSLSFSLNANRVTKSDSGGLFLFNGVPDGKIVLVVDSGKDRVRREAVVNQAPLQVSVILSK